MVSHDRDFLDRTVTEILAFEGDAKVHNVFGGYSDYMREIHGRASKAKQQKDAAKQAPKTSSPEPLDPMRKPLTYGEKLELEKLPQQMEALQTKLHSIQDNLDVKGLFEADPDAFQTLINAYESQKKQLAETEERWLELEERSMVD